ncbi:type II secretion system protein GspD [Verrucomicrobiota bacterium]
MKRFILFVLMIVILPGISNAEGMEPNRASDSSSVSTNGTDDIMADYERLAVKLLTDSEEAKDILFYECRHVSAETLRNVIDGFLSPAGTVSAGGETDVVVINDLAENLPLLKKIAEKIDRPVPQILIKAHIVEFTVDSDFEHEVNLAYAVLDHKDRTLIKNISSMIATPGANPNTTEGVQVNAVPHIRSDYEEESLTVFLRFLETRGKARILSAPSLILCRGAEGSIVTGEEVPILTQTITSGSVSTATEFKSVGVKLRVKPIMIADPKVRLTVNPEVSTVTGFTSGGTGVNNPIIAVRNAKTELQVIDGQLISIGGLFRREDREVKRRVPILGSIPLIGVLFRGTRIQSVQTQLVIFLTITILDDQGVVIKPSEIPEKVQTEIDRMDKRIPVVGDLIEDLKKIHRVIH